MNVKQLKDHIINNNLVEIILENLNCQNIKWHSSGYWTCGNPPPSDNPQAVTVYADNLNVINYTKDIPEPSDIFTLICFYKDINFFQSLKWVTDLLNIDYYRNDDADLPEALKITRQLLEMQNHTRTNEEDNTPIKPLPEYIKKYYPVIGNYMFLKDGISFDTQREFEVSYDNESNRIVFPIYDEIGNLISYKGRIFKDHIEEWEQKYLYLYPCPRNRILFGYNKTHPFIKKQGLIFVGEAEKFTMALWSYGVYNSIATSGTKVSQEQIDKISRLGVPVYICFDKDFTKDKVEKLADRFVQGIDIYCMYDEDNVLKDKESPSDKKENWEYMLKNNLYKIR